MAYCARIYWLTLSPPRIMRVWCWCHLTVIEIEHALVVCVLLLISFPGIAPFRTPVALAASECTLNSHQTIRKWRNQLTVITSNGSTYNAAKLIESSSFELNSPRCIMQISSFMPFSWMFVMVRLNMNFGIEYKADVIHTPNITICRCTCAKCWSGGRTPWPFRDRYKVPMILGMHK